MKVSDLINDSLAELGQIAADTPVEPPQSALAIRYANRMFERFSYLPLGYTTISSSSDTVTIPVYAEEWAVKQLACAMANVYTAFEGLEILKIDARQAYNDMLKHITIDVTQAYPAGLPVGVANERYAGATHYPESDDLELLEDGGYTILEG